MQIAQSMTIARYLAKEFNLAGKNGLEQAKADMVVDCVTDLLNALVLIYKEKDEAKKEELQKVCHEQTLPNAMKVLTGILTDNGGKFFVGTSLTWADIIVADFLHNFKLRGGDGVKLLDEFKALKGHMESVMALPNIKKWIETRPETTM